MRRIIVAISILALSLSSAGIANAQVTASVIVSIPTSSTAVNANGLMPAKVTFTFDGEGRFILWGRFVIDGIEGPSIYKTLDAPVTDPVVFDTFLPTYFGGSHKVYFELLSPNYLKTNETTYTVIVVTEKNVKIVEPATGKSVNQGDLLETVGEISLTGYGTKNISGYWLVDNSKKLSFTTTAQVANTAVIKVKDKLPTDEPGDHKVKLVVESPIAETSDEISYKVINQAPITIKFDTTISDINITLSSKAKVTAYVTITEAGTYNLIGGLYVDGALVTPFAKTLTGPGTFSFDFEIPTTSVGLHYIQFRLTSPAQIASNTISYRVVGESWVWPWIVQPADGTTVNQGSFLEAKLALRVGGKGTQKAVGKWMLDGNPWRDYEQLLTITSDTILYEYIMLPTDAPGWHKLKFVLSWPQVEVSNEIWYRVWGREQPPSFVDIQAMPQPPYPQTETFQLRIRANDDRGIKRCFVQVGANKVVDTDLGGLQIIDYMTPPLGPFPAGDYFWRVVLEDLDGLDSEYTGRFQVTSGKGTVEGFVLESGSNRPLVGANVVCGNRTATTDEYGKYRIEQLGLGMHVIQANYTSKKTGETTVNIYGDTVIVAPTIYLNEQGPVPVITQIIPTPGPLYPGQTYDLHVFIRNDGADGQDCEVAISCPDGIMLAIDPDTGFQYPSQSQVFLPGSFIEHRDGQPIRAIHPVAIVKWNSWGAGVTRKVLLRFTPVEAKPYEFWIRSRVKSGDQWELSPTSSQTFDQQGYPVKVETINILSLP
jgi:hypothetical protein